MFQTYEYDAAMTTTTRSVDLFFGVLVFLYDIHVDSVAGAYGVRCLPCHDLCSSKNKMSAISQKKQRPPRHVPKKTQIKTEVQKNIEEEDQKFLAQDCIQI